MKKWHLHHGLGCLLVCIAAASAGSQASSANEKPDPLLSTMQQEMQRAQTSLWKLDPAPYFLSYRFTTAASAWPLEARASL
jgi:p-aminobenzoyl-glutamate transporter AbgT